jgi:hypothetical protein
MGVQCALVQSSPTEAPVHNCASAWRMSLSIPFPSKSFPSLSLPFAVRTPHASTASSVYPRPLKTSSLCGHGCRRRVAPRHHGCWLATGCMEAVRWPAPMAVWTWNSTLRLWRWWLASSSSPPSSMEPGQDHDVVRSTTTTAALIAPAKHNKMAM